MQKSELFAQILTDYQSSSDVPPEEIAAAQRFCEYAESWLSQTPPIGVGHGVGALVLKFADGRELELLGSPVAAPSPGPSFSITGSTGGSVRAAGGMPADASLAITGTQSKRGL
jgi:hypothetical protein